ncbi:interferon gamma receptor 1 [Rhinichthys klamathensis goyatoka]|uniref:interferon gamma receptor 1 n=1 Tax=Rhinichthys klamathensis goyatoka TaxID=3034132 RepID=UPI0024B4DA87|nr:interferon gamma receptor 1 [Rhinichthys klamathensis goyatoka]
MRIRIYISVSVILILIQKSTSEAVSRPSPPVNLSIQCDNYGVEVRWEYPDLSQDVHFLVEVGESVNPNERKYDTTRNLSLNISSMLFNSAYNVYFVSVTAVRGGKSSDPCVSDDSFSFNKLATSKLKCYLDFPEVELSPNDGKLHIQFVNPLHLYRNTPALRNLTDDLKYTVETEEGWTESTCEMKTKRCEVSIGFSELKEVYCVNLTGQIGDRQLNLRRGSCFEGDIRFYPPFTVYLYPVLGVVLSLLFTTGIIMLLVKKCYSEIKKKSMAAFPNFLVFKPTQTHLCEPLKLNPEAVASELHIEPKEQTTLIEMCGDEEASSGDEDVGGRDLDNASPYGDNDLDEADAGDTSSGYDCPHELRLEMSPGDMVKAYGL